MSSIHFKAGTVSAIRSLALGGISAGILKDLRRPGIDAMRKGVIRLYSQTPANPVLSRQQHAVIAHRSAGILLNDVAVILSLSRVLQEQRSPLGCISGRGARAISFSSDHATRAGQINRRIGLGRIQQMNDFVADIVP